MNGTNYEVPHCGAFFSPHSHPSWVQIFASESCFQIPLAWIPLQKELYEIKMEIKYFTPQINTFIISNYTYMYASREAYSLGLITNIATFGRVWRPGLCWQTCFYYCRVKLAVVAFPALILSRINCCFHVRHILSAHVQSTIPTNKH